MKYLKTYNESATSKLKEMKEDIKDICIELEDDGFEISFVKRECHKYDNTYNEVEIRHPEIDPPRQFQIPIMRFKFDDIKEDILRIKDYLGSNYLHTKIQGGYNGNYITYEDYLTHIKNNDHHPNLGQFPIYGVRIGFTCK